MSDSDKPCGKYSPAICKAAMGFISLSSYIVIHQIDIISRHISVAFHIPAHNIGIYLEKLYCLRTLAFVIGGFIENNVFQWAGGDTDRISSMRVRRYFGVIAFAFLFVVRSIYLFLLFSSPNPAYHIYIILVVEAFFSGLHDTSFMALGSEFMSVISPMYNLCRIFISCCQFILDALWYQRPLFMVKIQVSIAVTFTLIAVVVWIYYNFRLKMETGPTSDQLVDIMKEPADSAIDLLFQKLFPEHYEELQQRRKKDKEVAEQLKKEKEQGKTTEGEQNTTQGNQQGPEGETEREKYCRERIGNDGVGAAVSPALMYWATTTFNDFMFPSVLPYGLLQRDKCHIINVLNPFFILIGPASLFILDNFTDRFGCWTWHFDLFWLLFIPLPIIFTLAMQAIFTRKPLARRIINSQPRVACMTLAAMFSFGCNDPLSFMGLGKYAFRQNPGGFTLLGYHISSALFCRYISSKIAVGFSDTRISLGYHLPKFRPNHRMSKRNLGWYIFRQTFKRTWEDAKGDLRLDIKKYL